MSAEKFAGYFRDSETGNDYAVNRYMSPATGGLSLCGRADHENPPLDGFDGYKLAGLLISCWAWMDL